MDVQLPDKKKGYLKYLLIGSLLMAAIIYLLNKSQAFQISLKETLISEVKQGTLNTEVKGFGLLQSQLQTLISAESGGTVKEILLRPGALVQADSVIATLSHPELDQQLEQAKQAYSQLQGQFRQLKLNQKRDALLEEDNWQQAKSEAEIAAIKYQAQAELSEKGIVSALELQESQVRSHQLSERSKNLQKRLSQLQQVQLEERQIFAEQISRQASVVEHISQRVANLSVKAGREGVLQAEYIEIGQQLAVGQRIALVGSIKDLHALIQIPQSQIDQVALQDRAEVMIRNQAVPAVVTRISPRVENGKVDIELHFKTSLPKSARPELSVQGKIIKDQLHQTLFVKRPSHVNAQGQFDIFKINDDLSIAKKIQVEFGHPRGEYVPIIKGLKKGEQIIVSKTAHFASLAQVELN